MRSSHTRLAPTCRRIIAESLCAVNSIIARMSGDRVFLPTRGGAATVLNLKKFWPRIAKLGGLPADVTPQVLRHSFASLAGDLGYSEPTIGALVGHKGHSVTSRYLHSADAVLLVAADAVANRTAELMGEAPQGAGAVIVPLRSAGAGVG